MAAENDFPLETIIIIVVVIVVLFIAIFFGSRFINTRIKKRRILSARPGNVKNETGGRGEHRYTGGNGGGAKDATSDNRDLIKTFIGESRDLLDLKNVNKKLAGVDTIHNMFRSTGINVPDGPMKEFYMSDNQTEIDNSELEFKKLIDDDTIVSNDNAKEIASMIDSVKIVLDSIKNCTFDVTTRDNFLLTGIIETDLKKILKDLLDNEYTYRLDDDDIKHFNNTLSFLVTLPNDIDKIQNVPNIVEQLIEDRTNVNSVIQNCGILAKDLDPMVRMHVDAGFYLEILKILDEENQTVAVLNNVFKTLQANTNSHVGLYMMMCKLGDKGRLNSYIAKMPNITKDADHTEEVAIEYINAQIVAYPELKRLSSNFSAIKDDVETQLKSGVLTPQPGGANAHSSGVPQPGGGSKLSTNPGDDVVVGSVGSVGTSIYDKQISYQYFLNIINIKLSEILSNATIYTEMKTYTIDTQKTIELRISLLLGKIVNPLKYTNLSKNIVDKFKEQYLNTDIKTGVISPKNEGFFGNKPKLDDIIHNLIRLLEQNITDFETKLKYINTALYNSDLTFIEKTRIETTQNIDKFNEKKLLENIKKISRKLKEKNLYGVYTQYMSDDNKLKFIANSLIFDGILGNKDTIKDDYKNRMYESVAKAPNNIEILKNVFNSYTDRHVFYNININTLLGLIKIIADYNDNLFKLRGLNMYINEYINKSDFTNIKAIYNNIYIINKQIQREKVVISTLYNDQLKNAKGVPLKNPLVESIYIAFSKQYGDENTMYLKLITTLEKSKEIKQIKPMLDSAETVAAIILKATKLDTSVQVNIEKYRKIVTDNSTIDFSWFTEQFDKKVAELEAAAKADAAALALGAELKQIIQDADDILTGATTNYTVGKTIVKDIEKRDAKKKLNDQLEEFKQYVDNQLGFIANIEAKKLEFDSKTGGTLPLQTGKFVNKYNSVNEQTNKFIALLVRVHGVTNQYHGTYNKIIEDLSANLNTSSLSDLTKKSSDIDPPYNLAKLLSDASADVSGKLGLHMSVGTSKEGILHKEITDITKEIANHKNTIDGLNKAILDKVQDKVTQAVTDVTARVEDLNAEITRITGVKDTIESDIDNKIMQNGISSVDALEQTDTTITEIAGLQAAITALKSIPATKFEDLISNAKLVDPVVDTTGLDGKIREYNDLIPTVANFATECNNKIFTDAIAKANILSAQCDKDLGNVTALLHDPVQYAIDVIRVKLVYTDMATYVEIVGKITNKTGPHYKKILDSQARLVVNIGQFGLDLTTHVNTLKQTIVDNIAQSSTILSVINSGSRLADVQTATRELEDIHTRNIDIFQIINTIGNNSDIMSLLPSRIISKKYMTDTPKDMQKVNEALDKSKELEDEVRLKSTAAAAAAVLAAAAAAASASIAAANDTNKLKKAAEDVKETIAKIKTDYTTEYDLNTEVVKKAALANVKTITDNLPRFNTYIDSTESNLGTVKTNIVSIPSINDAEITSLNAKVTIVDAELATIKQLYNDLNLWNTQDITGNEPFKVDINAAITANVQTSFTNAIHNAEAICDTIIDGIVNGTINTTDIVTKQADLTTIVDDTIPTTIIPAKTTVIDALKTAVLATIKNDVIDPNKVKVTNINTELAKSSFDAVITDALLASKKLVDVITDDTVAIETIITDDIDALPDLNAIADGQQVIVGDIDPKDVLLVAGNHTQEKLNAIDAVDKIRGSTATPGIADSKIPAQVTIIRDNLAKIKAAKKAVNDAYILAQDNTNTLTVRIDRMVKIYKEYTAAKNLKSECDTSIAEIKKLTYKLQVLINVIKLSDNIVKYNIEVFIINEDAKVKLAVAVAIRDANQQIKNNVNIELADMQNKVNRIIAKVSSVQDPGIVQAVNAVNNEFARLQQTNTQIDTKFTDLNTEYTNNILDKQVLIVNNLNKFADSAHNFKKNLKFWKNVIVNNTGEDKTISDLSTKYRRDSKRNENSISTRKMTKQSNYINQFAQKFARDKAKVLTALKQAITVYQLIMNEDDEDDDEPIIVQQPEDDKVKPFSQNSYDILPLDHKIATLSSNIEFSESVDYKPVNSFMYVVTPYDKKEQSPDDKVLEMVSFARTLRMPIKDKSVITKASELFKKYHGTKKIIPGMWVSRGGKLVTAVKPTNIDELERYIELMNRSNQF